MSDQPDPKRPDSEIVPVENALASRARSVVDRAVENYAASPALRSFTQGMNVILSASPQTMPLAVAFTMLDVHATAHAQRLHEERTRRLGEHVAREIVNHASAVSAEFFDKDEGLELMLRAIGTSSRVNDEARRVAIARILVAAASGNVPPAAEAEGLVAVLGEMTENEAAMLGAMWTLTRQGRSQFEPYYEWEAKELPVDFAQQSAFLTQRLAGRGLLIERVETHSMTERPKLLRMFEFTPTGAALMLYLEVNPPAPA